MLIELANQTIEKEYPQYGKNGKLLTLEVRNGKVVVIGPNGGPTNLFKADGRTLNPQVLKIKAHQKILGPHWTELIEITGDEIEELNKTLQEDTVIADDKNEQPSVRDRARERITENTKRRDQLVQERERIVKKKTVFSRKILVTC